MISSGAPARIWLNGEEYPVSATSGEAVIPFAAISSGPQTAVLIAADDFAALATLHLQSESYSLAAGAGALLCICGHNICTECAPATQWCSW